MVTMINIIPAALNVAALQSHPLLLALELKVGIRPKRVLQNCAISILLPEENGLQICTDDIGRTDKHTIHWSEEGG